MPVDLPGDIRRRALVLHARAMAKKYGVPEEILIGVLTHEGGFNYVLLYVSMILPDLFRINRDVFIYHISPGFDLPLFFCQRFIYAHKYIVRITLQIFIGDSNALFFPGEIQDHQYFFALEFI